MIRTWVVGAMALGTLTACVGSSQPQVTVAAPVEVVGPYRDGEADQIGSILDLFTAAARTDVRYTGSSDFVDDLNRRLGEGATPPDVAIVSQPGFFRQLVGDGKVVELGADAASALDSNYRDVSRDLGTVDGVGYGVPTRLNVKSLVWYRPDVFAQQGWAVPQSLDGLQELADTIVDETDLAPWCVALRSGGATGWPATDWVEDIVLRRQGSDAFAAWTDGSLPFTSSEIEAAFDEFAELVLAPGYLDGGVSAAVEATTDEVFDGLFADPPRCAMVKQADFAASWLPDDVTIGDDVMTFVLPAVEPTDEPPLVVGVDVAVAFDDEPTTQALMTYLARPEVGSSWVAAGGFISPKSSIEIDDYPDEFERDLAARVSSTEVLALDASDAMPPSVGTTLFWNGIIAWMAGAVDYEQFATSLDEAFAIASADG